MKFSLLFIIFLILTQAKASRSERKNSFAAFLIALQWRDCLVCLFSIFIFMFQIAQFHQTQNTNFTQVAIVFTWFCYVARGVIIFCSSLSFIYHIIIIVIMQIANERNENHHSKLFRHLWYSKFPSIYYFSFFFIRLV